MFWERLNQQCLQKNCKPNTVAKAIGLSNAIATKWKNGAIPNGEALSKIADYLDCSVDYLLGREAPKKEPTAFEDERQAELLEIFDRMPDEESKENLMQVVRSLESIATRCCNNSIIHCIPPQKK